ncbi:MAG TPA: hypothetical protein VH813_07520 [Candidatus Limnocylindrales bacterium]|jgi:hypothetical protein
MEEPRTASVPDPAAGPVGDPDDAPSAASAQAASTTRSTEPDPTWSTDSATQSQAPEWLAQLQSMIEGLASQAAPVVREIGAKAAELAALAGEKAGPIAHRAADATEHAGARIAERGRVVAKELRRDAQGENGHTEDGHESGDPATTTAEPTDTTSVS